MTGIKRKYYHLILSILKHFNFDIPVRQKAPAESPELLDLMKVFIGTHIADWFRGAASNASPGQLSFPWDLCRVSENPDVKAVSEKFINANSYNAEFIQKMQKLHNRVPGMEIAQ